LPWQAAQAGICLDASPFSTICWPRASVSDDTVGLAGCGYGGRCCEKYVAI
jgi:hypothetical protein